MNDRKIYQLKRNFMQRSKLEQIDQNDTEIYKLDYHVICIIATKL